MSASWQRPTQLEQRTDDPVTVLPRSIEPFLEQPLELLERLAVNTSQNLDVLERQLEWRCLKADVSGRVGKHEAKVDVDQMAVTVDEDVAIMAILDLQEICNDGVSCK